MPDAIERQPNATSPGAQLRQRVLAVVLIALLCLPPTVIARAQDAALVDDGAATETTLPEPDVNAPGAALSDQATPDALEPEVVATAVPANTDSVDLSLPAGETPFAPGESRALQMSYLVSTPRLATTFVAQIGDAGTAPGGWTIQLEVLDQWSEPGEVTSITDATNLAELTTVTLTLIVTAPAERSADQTVPLPIWLSSTVLRLDGSEEPGLAATEPITSVTIVAPAVETELPTLEPTVEPTFEADPTVEPTVETEPSPAPPPVFTPLLCAANQAAAVPGDTLEITCPVPDDAWAQRGDAPTYSYLTSGEMASGADSPLADQVIAISLGLPCAMPSSELWVSVEVAVAAGIALQTVVTVPVGTNAVDAAPVVSYSDVSFGTAVWSGTSWSPVSATVTVTIDDASSACSVNEWIILATVSPLSGEAEIAPAITFAGGVSSSEAIIAASPGELLPGTPVIIGSGSGSGALTLQFTLFLPPDVSAGSYHGAMSFEIATGP